MSYPLWHKKTVKKVAVYPDIRFYIRTFIFSLFVFAGVYLYITKVGTPNALNKSMADTSIILIGLSMLLTSLCYFWDFVDTKIIYRKYLGVIGFFYGVVHTLLSLSAFLSLFKTETWAKGTPWPVLSGGIALGIFAIMTLISNRYAVYTLGGIMWRRILRVGYIAVALVWVHVYLLKSARIITWYTGGMKTPPSASLIVLIFMTIVVVMRILLWISLLKKQNAGK
jgi:DMSO/TMAO reductase YedYZ heme-binding membrane subunit